MVLETLVSSTWLLFLTHLAVFLKTNVATGERTIVVGLSSVIHVKHLLFNGLLTREP